MPASLTPQSLPPFSPTISMYLSVINARLHPADVVTHDEQNIGFRFFGQLLEQLTAHGSLQSSNMLPQSYGGFDQSPMSAMAYHSLHPIHHLFPLSEARLHCPHLFSMRDACPVSMRDACPDRPGMWGRVRRLRRR